VSESVVEASSSGQRQQVRRGCGPGTSTGVPEEKSSGRRASSSSGGQRKAAPTTSGNKKVAPAVKSPVPS